MQLIRTNLLGLPIDILYKRDLLEHLKEKLKLKERTSIYGLCIGSLSRIKNKKKDLPDMLKKFTIIIADGGGIPILGKIFGVRIPEKIAITELAYDLLVIANKEKYKVLLFGASEENNNLAVLKLRENYPNAIFPSGINGYYKKDDEKAIVENINKINPDILLIGMTYPLKEKFTTDYQDMLNTTIILPCGGAIDVFAGKTKRPRFKIKFIPTTWLYRWIQEPSRLSIKPDLRFVFKDFPVLFLKHTLRKERNPSLLKHYFGDVK